MTPGQARVLEMLRAKAMSTREVAEAFPTPISDSDVAKILRQLVAEGLIEKEAPPPGMRSARYRLVVSVARE